jgi:hypothetical protein
MSSSKSYGCAVAPFGTMGSPKIKLEFEAEGVEETELHMSGVLASNI